MIYQIKMAADDIPRAQKAWLVTKNGEPKDALTLKTDCPVPRQVKSGNVLVRVDYAALNPADLNFMANLPNWLPFRRNPTAGLDFAGRVVQVGSAVPPALGLSVGSEVCGAFNVLSVAVGRGSLAEYVEVPAAKVAPRPDGVRPRDAAGALGIAGQTAWLVLKEAGGVGPGDRVLVNGASGGVGSVLVQVARAKGAAVCGVCSGANAGFVRALGAEEVCMGCHPPTHRPGVHGSLTTEQVIDYKAHEDLTAHLSEAFPAGSKPFQHIFDCVGSDDLFRRCGGYLDKTGIFVTIVGGVGAGPIVRSKFLPVALGGVPRRYKLLALWPDGNIAKEVAKWVENGDYHTFPLDSEYSMEDVVKVRASGGVGGGGALSCVVHKC